MTSIRYTEREELANSISHGIGILVAIIVGCLFLRKAGLNTDPYALPAVSIYIFGVLITYIVSTLYHATVPGNNKEILRKFDHATIFFQIAATYTPICLLVLRNSGYWG